MKDQEVARDVWEVHQVWREWESDQEAQQQHHQAEEEEHHELLEEDGRRQRHEVEELHGQGQVDQAMKNAAALATLRDQEVVARHELGREHENEMEALRRS